MFSQARLGTRPATASLRVPAALPALKTQRPCNASLGDGCERAGRRAGRQICLRAVSRYQFRQGEHGFESVGPGGSDLREGTTGAARGPPPLSVDSGRGQDQQQSGGASGSGGSGAPPPKRVAGQHAKPASDGPGKRGGRKKQKGKEHGKGRGKGAQAGGGPGAASDESLQEIRTHLEKQVAELRELARAMDDTNRLCTTLAELVGGPEGFREFVQHHKQRNH